jgi:hypothetical protein
VRRLVSRAVTWTGGGICSSEDEYGALELTKIIVESPVGEMNV